MIRKKNRRRRKGSENMKKIVVKWLCVVLGTFLIPFCMKSALPPEGSVRAPSAPAEAAREKADTIRVWFPDRNKTEEMALRDYIIGVTAAEMPVSFAHDALCAQALASLTYALLAGVARSMADVFELLVCGIRQCAPLFVIYILFIQFYESLRFVFW